MIRCISPTMIRNGDRSCWMKIACLKCCVWKDSRPVWPGLPFSENVKLIVNIFFQYSIESIASLTDQQLQIKLEDASLIRHRGNLNAIRENAQACLKPRQQGINRVDWHAA